MRGSGTGSTGHLPAPSAVAVALAAELERVTGIHPRLGKRLAANTTMRVGGPADLLVVATSAAEIEALVRFASERRLPWLVLGRGSNVVIADAGVRGLVMLNRAEGARFDGDRLIAESGLPLARAATLSQRVGLSGLEFGLAIPGTVGGAVWANAGAHGTDVAAVLESVTVLGADGTRAVEPAAALDLAYRESRFKNVGQGSGPAKHADVILSATFHLSAADPSAIKDRLDEIRRWRQEYQPLSQPSAGSVFRNPPGDSAGRLIEACGLKGTCIGGAQISEKHANFIVNVGGATAADIRRLADRASDEVAARFGIELAHEVQFIGDWSEPQQESA